jgi:hypothetical protein
MVFPACRWELGLFCIVAPRPRGAVPRNWLCFPKRGIEAMSHDFPLLDVLSPRYSILPKFGFVSRSGASRRCRTFCPATHVPAAPSRPAPPGIGFVLHDCPSTLRGLGVPSASSGQAPARHSPKLGLFRTFRPPVPAELPEIGFVWHNRPARAGGGRSVPIRNPKSKIRNREIGFVWHDSHRLGMVE